MEYASDETKIGLIGDLIDQKDGFAEHLIETHIQNLNIILMRKVLLKVRKKDELLSKCWKDGVKQYQLADEKIPHILANNSKDKEVLLGIFTKPESPNFRHSSYQKLAERIVVLFGLEAIPAPILKEFKINTYALKLKVGDTTKDTMDKVLDDRTLRQRYIAKINKDTPIEVIKTLLFEKGEDSRNRTLSKFVSNSRLLTPERKQLVEELKRGLDCVKMLQVEYIGDIEKIKAQYPEPRDVSQDWNMRTMVRKRLEEEYNRKYWMPVFLLYNLVHFTDQEIGEMVRVMERLANTKNDPSIVTHRSSTRNTLVGSTHLIEMCDKYLGLFLMKEFDRKYLPKLYEITSEIIHSSGPTNRLINLLEKIEKGDGILPRIAKDCENYYLSQTERKGIQDEVIARMTPEQRALFSMRG